MDIVVGALSFYLTHSHGSFHFGLMDSNDPIPKVDEILGSKVKNSASLCSFGNLFFNTPSSQSYRYCTNLLHEGDCVRMEVDLDSTPRTVQFFVNGEVGWFYVSGIPSSVRIGVSVLFQGSSLRIDNISRLSQPTPFSKEMKESVKKGEQEGEMTFHTENGMPLSAKPMQSISNRR
ncbi:hypothetical protein BLNAU_12774 [Blattamonas nauphoetae]|uniref:NHR domain-containing protein n=1 Tax=Blattamonas nauphoetae TaxID=2049346 RepID=A0ABQ9XM01_9EUKA|nr:hypothetical protein BLNAU_12774 [Blattamonas nauphoetae]